MQEYAQKPEQSSSDSNSRSSGQPPISEILQAYKNGTLQRMSVDEEELLQAKTRDKSSERETLQLYTDYTHRDKSRYNSFIQGMFDTPQRKGVGNEEPLQGKFDSSSAASESTVQREVKPNNTGLPDNLKSGIENLSGYSLDDVKVHYNSDKPAQLSALAYAQGTDIHVAPGQEKHLPHEAWHVVQQKQGRVQPTMQMQGVDVNDNEGLEKEADVMGGKALSNDIEMNNHAINKKYNTTTIQKISFYHGTTIEDAENIERNIVPSLGKGEFGKGFYTVFSEQQAKHIAMYYWDNEQKWKKNKTGVAVVKISIPDNWWKDLMKTLDKKYNVIFRNGNKWFNTEGDPYEGRTEEAFEFDDEEASASDDEEAFEFDDEEASEADDIVDWMPQRKMEDLKYEKDSEVDLENDITIGPIKDTATPYMQVVFGAETADYLLNEIETIKTITWKKDYDDFIGSGVYSEIKTKAVDELGSLYKTERIKCMEFRKRSSNLVDIDDRRKRYSLLMKIFAKISDLPNDVITYLKENGVTGENNDAVVFNWWQSGFITTTTD